ncbi:MAG: YdeI/OmpD-associated family protein [Defluviitaleaceae bacterium]|nr:YdeI/OmpD-associated family protein [Defluviitaleaceae bacterium]
MEQDKKAVIVPGELSAVMETDFEAKEFFASLSDGYKRGYCDWVGSAKQESTRQTRAGKALIMLQNKQKTLKT